MVKNRGGALANQDTKRTPAANAGLTVIETLIVLAVGGLILLIVLFAVPALQRSSRNNQRRQDVQAILGAVSHWELNHSGNIPATTDPYLQDAKTKLTYYTATNIIVHGGSSGDPASVAPLNNLDKVNIYNYQKCSTATPSGSTATGAGYSDVVALYAIEAGGSPAAKCQQL